jgi:hypothetical protein
MSNAQILAAISAQRIFRVRTRIPDFGADIGNAFVIGINLPLTHSGPRSLHIRNEEAAMNPEEGRYAYIVDIAFELARTGNFEDFDSVEREVVAEGLGEGVIWIERPGIRSAITQLCNASHRVDRWREHTAA